MLAAFRVEAFYFQEESELEPEARSSPVRGTDQCGGSKDPSREQPGLGGKINKKQVT